MNDGQRLIALKYIHVQNEQSTQNFNVQCIIAKKDQSDNVQQGIKIA
jgi:hypothetical protein